MTVLQPALLYVILAVMGCWSIDTSQLHKVINVSDKMMDESDIYTYCNHHQSVTGQEGKQIDGYELEQVHIVLTPGHSDVSDKFQVPGVSFPKICSTEIKSDVLNRFTTMIDMYNDVTRNVHFSHMHSTFPHLCSSNHLMTNSLLTLISIGQHLSTSYFNAKVHSRLKPKYSHIHIESIPSHKAFHSLLAFLHGFLADKQIYKTKIHQANSNFCEFIESDLVSCKCSKVSDLLPYLSKSLSKGMLMFKDVVPGIDTISQVFQTNFNDISGVDLFYLLMQYKCDMRMEPCENSSFCHMLDKNKLETLANILATNLHNLKTDPVFQTFAELKVYPFLQQLISRSSHMEEPKTVYVYMAHGHFLESLSASLRISRKEVSPVASRLVVEFYKRKLKDQSDSDHHYLRVLYNGNDVTSTVRGCGDLMVPGLCTTESFRRELNDLRSQYLQQCF